MTAPDPEGIADRRRRALDRIAAAAGRARRDPAGIALMAVSKGHGPDAVRAAAQAGQRLFGENRVAEGARKIESLKNERSDLTWRLIGSLQTNKASMALQYFSAFESLDRQRLVERLERLLEGSDQRVPVLIEVNLGQEASKSGVAPDELDGLAAGVDAAPHLELRGLMAVPPFDAEPEASRPHFRRLREFRDRLAQRRGRELPELSMGMSHDFEVAVEEGATEVRIGTALFGPRVAP